MKKIIPFAAIALTMISSHAGDWGKSPVDKSPIEECVDLGGEISVGYDTDYVFYGARIARGNVWTDVNYTFENFAVPITIGAWYLNSFSPANYDELNLYIGAELGTYAGFDTSVSYTHFFFPEPVAAGSTGEVAVDVSRDLGFVDFNARAVYFFTGGLTPNGGGFYYEAGIEKSITLTDAASLVFATGVGYSDNYIFGFRGDSGWNHYYARLSLPLELNCRTTLTPYLGYNGSPDTWVIDNLGTQSDILHGGVSLTVSF